MAETTKDLSLASFVDVGERIRLDYLPSGESAKVWLGDGGKYEYEVTSVSNTRIGLKPIGPVCNG